jgi:hypothetical protein
MAAGEECMVQIVSWTSGCPMAACGSRRPGSPSFPPRFPAALIFAHPVLATTGLATQQQ